MYGNLDSRDALLADFVAMSMDGASMLVRQGHERHAPLLGRPETADGGHTYVEGGRQAHPVLEMPGGERVVVRTYRRGGAMRHFNRDRYFLGHRAFDELRATERARLGGVRVPFVVAATERRRRVGYTAALATLWIPDSRDGADWLAQASGAEKLATLTEAGRQIARMHDAGVAHPDLNLRNLLIAWPAGRAKMGAPAVYLIDFDRARLFPGAVPPGRRERDLRRLARSARKLAAPIGPDEWRAIREGYGAD